MSFIFNLMINIISKSKQLLTLASESKWEEFSHLDAERQALLRDFDLENIEMSEHDNQQLSEQINRLLVLNEEIASYCISQRTNIAQELQNLRKSNTAAKAYSQ